MTLMCIVFIIEYLHETVQRTSLLKELRSAYVCTHNTKQTKYLSEHRYNRTECKSKKNITM